MVPAGSASQSCNARLARTDSGYVSMSEHPSYLGRLNRAMTAPAEGPDASEPDPDGMPTRRYSGRACCCPAQPVVVVVLPPRGDRPAETDLVLCGHHYRVSKAALAAAGATILDMTGHRLEDSDWPGDSC